MDKLELYTQNNVISYCEKITDDEVLEIALYLSGGYIENDPSTNVEKFLYDFIGERQWNQWIVRQRSSEKSFFHNNVSTGTLVSDLYGYVSFQYLVRSKSNRAKETNKKLNNFKTKLGKELDNAIEVSFDGDTFYKADAFSNIADILTKHKLIDLTKYDKDEE